MGQVFVYRNGELVPKETAPPIADRKTIHVISDIQPFMSPIDRTVLTSRSHVREHERKHGVRQIGNDWKPPMEGN